MIGMIWLKKVDAGLEYFGSASILSSMYCEYIVRMVLPNLQCFKFRCNEGYTSVTFYVKNYIQKKWIEVNHCDDIVD